MGRKLIGGQGHVNAGGHDLVSTTRGKISEERRSDLPPNICEGVSVKEKEWRAAMALPQEIYGLLEREDFRLLCRPVARARRLSLSIKAVLRASSCARSLIEVGDKLPTPVFEKLGSGL
jgi:hypothetical protein